MLSNRYLFSLLAHSIWCHNQKFENRLKTSYNNGSKWVLIVFCFCLCCLNKVNKYATTKDKWRHELILILDKYQGRKWLPKTGWAIKGRLLEVKTITKIAEKWDCWVCQILQFTSKGQNSLVLKLKKWFQRWDSIQNSI